MFFALYARIGAPLLRNAREVDLRTYPWLESTMRRLSGQAGLDRVPRIYLTPGQIPNAAAILSASSPRIVVTTALADSMDQSQLAGVLAHELAHIHNRDLLILGLSGALHELVAFTGQLGWLFILIWPWPCWTGRSGPGCGTCSRTARPGRPVSSAPIRTTPSGYRGSLPWSQPSRCFTPVGRPHWQDAAGCTILGQRKESHRSN
ncbi:MAG: M48 family metalloprotease [Spirochaetota bacterium]